MESNKSKELRHRARRKSIEEGIFTSARSSFGENYISPFAIAINSSNSLVALLSSVSGIIGPLTQTFSSKLMEKYPRKKIVIKSVFFECLTWLLFVLVAFLFYKGIFVMALPLMLLLFFSIHTIFTNSPSPAWFSWHGDLVDEEFRGRWFSKRGLIMGFVTIVFTIAAALFLDYTKRNGLVMIGFIFLFIMAFAARTISLRIFKRMYEPKIKLKIRDYFSFHDFLTKAPTNNFGRFAIFTGFLDFATYISLPFVTVYLLRYLDFSYITYMMVMLLGHLLSLFFLGLWGKIADRYGNYVVLHITSAMITLIPILWVLNPSPLYLAFVPSLVSGISRTGFELARKDFIYDNVRKEKRGFAVSYYGLVSGIGVFFGAGLGALLIKFLDTSFVEPIILIFFISGLLRMLVVFFGIKKIKEMKKAKRFRGRRSFMWIMSKEAKPTIIEEFHEIRYIDHYLKK